MSLHALAHHMQSKGRNGDSVLVHMTPGEVQGLQALAMKHGGSLTINPETGLVEANWLKSLLPTLLGFGLNMAFPGLGSAMGGFAIPALVGGGSALASGSLKQGLMAGMGAYGGMGLSQGLMASAPLTGTPQATPVPAGMNPAPIQTGASTPQMSAIEQARLSNAANPSSVYSQITGQNMAPTQAATYPSAWDQLSAGAKASFGNGMTGLKGLASNMPTGSLLSLGGTLLNGLSENSGGGGPPDDKGSLRPYALSREQNPDAYSNKYTYYDSNNQRMPVDSRGYPMDTRERKFFNDTYTALPVTKLADGGLSGLNAFAVGGQAENSAAMNSVGMNATYPMAHLDTPMYTTPMVQRPQPKEVVNPAGDVEVDAFTGEPRWASGGITGLGSYSDGGHLLKGPGDGVSDSIPASIGNRQPARLADGEFVIPARIVSEIGNGSTDAGARKLYKMMDRVQHARRKTVGKHQVAKNTNAEKLMPA